MNRYKVTLIAHTENCMKALGESPQWKRTGNNTFERLENARSEAFAISRSTANVWYDGRDRKDFDVRTEKLGAVTYGLVEILWRDTRELTDFVFTSERRAYEYGRDYFSGRNLRVAVAFDGIRADGHPLACIRDTLVAEGFRLFHWADKVMNCSESYTPAVRETWNDKTRYKIAILDASDHENRRISSIPEHAIGWIRVNAFRSKTVHPNSDGKYLAVGLGERKIELAAMAGPAKRYVVPPPSIDSELRNFNVKIEPLILNWDMQRRLDSEYEEKFAQWK